MMADRKQIRVLENLQNEIRQLRGEFLSLREEMAESVPELEGALRRRGLEPFRRNPPPGVYILGSKKSISRNIAACFRNHFTLALAPEQGKDLPEPIRG